ncbi:uncharacterized protein LOC103713122 isoform X2 [Phoenix dactylifera]|uniref:Uncharacterized protein LOC103713122 isoform X2 n=1 Tax=Phoenix dactylifera TaxID=42345 RepID=A0A8B7CFF6_PHODC|nr:uncharacterized protein LOC103713122 isoform X2 [Phoenix dactylifera]
MAVWNPSRSMDLHRWLRCSPSSAGSSSATVAVAWRGKKRRTRLLAANCTPLRQSSDTQQQVEEEEVGIMCDSCDGRGWLLCDFCEGKKTYVKAENNRIYRRCPTCRAIGYILCAKCKVFKCITFPDYSDGEL